MFYYKLTLPKCGLLKHHNIVLLQYECKQTGRAWELLKLFHINVFVSVKILLLKQELNSEILQHTFSCIFLRHEAFEQIGKWMTQHYTIVKIPSPTWYNIAPVILKMLTLFKLRSYI